MRKKKSATKIERVRGKEEEREIDREKAKDRNFSNNLS